MKWIFALIPFVCFADKYIISWDAAKNASEYGIVITSNTGVSSYELVSKTNIEVSLVEGRSYKVQVIPYKGNIVGNISKPIYINTSKAKLEPAFSVENVKAIKKK